MSRRYENSPLFGLKTFGPFLTVEGAEDAMLLAFGRDFDDYTITRETHGIGFLRGYYATARLPK